MCHSPSCVYLFLLVISRFSSSSSSSSSTINLFLRPYFCILPITTLIILIMRLNKKPSFYIKSLILSYLGYHLLGSSYFFYLQCHSQPLPTTEIRKQLNRSKFPIIGTNEMWFIDMMDFIVFIKR